MEIIYPFEKENNYEQYYFIYKKVLFEFFFNNIDSCFIHNDFKFLLKSVNSKSKQET
jgi:hypothetical protein